jgi:hypothetical protein
VIKFVSKLQQVSSINKTDSCDKTEVFLKVAAPIETELGKNIRWMVLYKVYAFCFDWKFNLVAMVINVLLMAKKN